MHFKLTFCCYITEYLYLTVDMLRIAIAYYHINFQQLRDKYMTLDGQKDS